MCKFSHFYLRVNIWKLCVRGEQNEILKQQRILHMIKDIYVYVFK